MLHSTCTLHPCTDADSRTLLTYDSAGRVLTENKRLDGTVYGYTATYDGDGRLSTLAYPSE